HFGVVRVLAEQLWVMRDVTLTDAVVVAMNLIETTSQPARQESPPVPRPARTLPKERLPLPPVENKRMTLPTPAVHEVIKSVDSAMEPASPSPPPADTPLTSSQTPSRPVAALPAEQERETSRGAGPAVDEVRKSSTSDAPGTGSSNVPLSGSSVPKLG